MSAGPNAWLNPQPGRDHSSIWFQAGTLHIATDVRYNSQPIVAIRTGIRSLGVSSWHMLIFKEDDPVVRSQLETALGIWCNSTLGLALNAYRTNRTQEGRGRGNKGTLESLVTLDVRMLEPWQLDEMQAIWRDFRDRTFQPFYRCAVDLARVELDERVVRDLLSLGEDAAASMPMLRRLLASEPSIYGVKKPELPC